MNKYAVSSGDWAGVYKLGNLNAIERTSASRQYEVCGGGILAKDGFLCPCRVGMCFAGGFFRGIETFEHSWQ